MRNPTDHPTKQSFYLARLQRTKTQGIGEQHRPCTHRENIANNATHSSSGSFEGFNRTWVIMGLDLKGNAPALTYIDYTGIFLTSFDQNLTNGIFILFLGRE